MAGPHDALLRFGHPWSTRPRFEASGRAGAVESMRIGDQLSCCCKLAVPVRHSSNPATRMRAQGVVVSHETSVTGACVSAACLPIPSSGADLDRVTSGTWTRCSSASEASCTISGARCGDEQRVNRFAERGSDDQEGLVLPCRLPIETSG